EVRITTTIYLADHTFLFFYTDGPRRALHSFPTRRSSDLGEGQARARQDVPDRLRAGPARARRGAEERLRESPPVRQVARGAAHRSEEHTSELQSRENLVCRLLLEKKKK